jgi:acetylornithine deacetylase/succinyl-diaminopimelate desuccinylase-like protein
VTRPDTGALKQAVLSSIDDHDMVRFLTELVEVASPTGHELAAAAYIASELRELGADVKVQQFDEDRANVIATLRGSGGGSAVMLNGHLDTSYTGLEAELEGAGYKNKAVFAGQDWLYGNGVHNMKNALASYYAIFRGIAKSRVSLRGDVILAGVAGEIEKAPFGAYQGPEYEGFGAGTTYALAHGLNADMCILGEPTANTIGLSNMGVNWVRLSTAGSMAHTQHADTAQNAIYQMEKVLVRLSTWREEYRNRHVYDGIRPACDVTAINGGWPWRASRTPVYCDVFLCIRTTPGMRTTTVRQEVDDFVRELQAADSTLRLQTEFYATHQATEISADEPVVQALDRNHRQLMGDAPEYRRRTAYMDSSALVAHGIPTVVYGPSGRLNTKSTGSGWSPEEGEHLYLPDLYAGTRVVAATVVDLCSSERQAA